MKFVLACLTRNGGNTEKSPILSPLNSSGKLLNLLPKVRIFVSEVDCLRDHSFQFLD